MPVYAYRGVTNGGKAARGHVDAESVKGARARLRRDGIFPTEIAEGRSEKAAPSEASRRFRLRLPQRISAFDLALATRQAATLLGAGIPLVESLRALTDQVENPRLKAVYGQVRERVNQGASFADALGASKVFPDLYVSMVRAGEASGQLSEILARLADYLEASQRLKREIAIRRASLPTTGMRRRTRS